MKIHYTYSLPKVLGPDQFFSFSSEPISPERFVKEMVKRRCKLFFYWNVNWPLLVRVYKEFELQEPIAEFEIFFLNSKFELKEVKTLPAAQGDF